MSRLIDELKRIVKNGPQAIGFRQGQAIAPKQRLLLAACMTGVDYREVDRYTVGADAGIVIPSDGGPDAIKKCSTGAPGIPWGYWLKDIGQSKIDFKRADCDFIIFPFDAPLAAVGDASAGKIIEIDIPLPDSSSLRTLDRLPLDAVLVSMDVGNRSSLTWHQLVGVQKVIDSVSKPVLTVVPAQVTATELGMLWEAGIDGVVVTIGAGQPQNALERIRQEIEKQTPSSRRKKRKTEALLPQVESETEEIEEED